MMTYVLNLLEFIRKVMDKLKFPFLIRKKYSYLSNLLTEKYLKRYFNDAKASTNSDYNEYDDVNSVIWIFWWQGYESMPCIVKKCYESICRNAGNHKVILLSSENLSDYTDISENIYKKFKNGYIGMAHFSDIVRFNVLKNNGGLWIDSTMYCSKKIDDKYFNFIFTSCGQNDVGPLFVEGRWTEFLIGGHISNPIFKFIDDFFQNYFKDNNKVTSYFMTDSVLKYCYDHNIGCFREYCDNYAINNNKNVFQLSQLLNSKFDYKIYNKITKDTELFKLSYKEKFCNDENTFYKKIIDNEMP